MPRQIVVKKANSENSVQKCGCITDKNQSVIIHNCSSHRKLIELLNTKVYFKNQMSKLMAEFSKSK